MSTKVPKPRSDACTRLGGLGALLEEYGEFAVGTIKALLAGAMITGGRVGHVRTWAIEQERGKLCQRCGINTRAAGGALSRCLVCLKADVEADRRDREARAAGTFAVGGEPS